jgi:hypothetical protein
MISKLYDIFRPSMTFSDRLEDRRERWWVKGQSNGLGDLSGKLEGRSFMERNGFKVPEQYGLYSNIADIPDFSQLPRSFVLKPSSGYSARNVFVIREGVNLLNGQPYDSTSIQAELNQFYKDRPFKGKFIVEEFLVNWDGKEGIPLDYKFYTFGEKIAFIHAIERNSGINLKSNRHWFMKEDWSPLGMKIQKYQEPQETPLPKPDCYDELIHTVKKVGRTLNIFMRIDMYATTRGAVFGEFTPTPHGGKGYTEQADRWLGRLWTGEEGGSDRSNADVGQDASPARLMKRLLRLK